MTEPQPDPKPDPKPDDPKPDDPPDDLGLDDRQSRAFEELRRENANRRRAERAAQTVNDELRAELERIRTDHESENEKIVREAVEVARAEVVASYEQRLLEAQIARQAAGKLRDPEDAVRLLPIADLVQIADEGERARRVDAAIAELLETKSYLALNGQTETPPSRTSLVTQGGRSAPPRDRREGTDADSWIRSRAGRR